MSKSETTLNNEAKHDICQKSLDDLVESLYKGEERKAKEDKLIKSMRKHFLKNIMKL